MQNQPHRSFNPQNRAPLRGADGLRGRMRAPVSGHQAVSQPPQPQQPVPQANLQQASPQQAPQQPTPQPYQAPHPHAAQQHQPPQYPYQQQSGRQIPQAQPIAPQPGPDNSGTTITLVMPGLKMPKSTTAWVKSAINDVRAVELPKFNRESLPSPNAWFMKASAGVLAGLVLVVGLFALYSQTIGSKNPAIPADLQFKAKFALFYPPKNNALKIDKKTYKYEPQDGLISFVSYSPSKTKLTVSQQAAPAFMVAGNPAYQTLVKSLPGVKSFKTANGTVTATHTANKANPGFAFMTKDGTMMIIRPSKTVSDAEWKQIFNSFETVKN